MSTATSAGIHAFGGYVPRLRLQRRTIAEANAWFNPALEALGRGERAIAGWDEDSITMAVEAARDCLALLSGRRHRVFGSIHVIDPAGNGRARDVVTAVAFKRLSRGEIEDYVSGGEWRDKAGGYAIQGRAGTFVRFLGGSYFNVVGLPLYETVSLLEGMGYRRPGDRSVG